jgi:hypothetical protein
VKAPRDYSWGSIKEWTLSWASRAENYSSRKLTFDKDKLLALAGLAPKVQKETKHTYLAGLWLETLAWYLLWSATTTVYQHEKPRQRKALLDLAPPWSWASVDSIVVIPELWEDCLITDIT